MKGKAFIKKFLKIKIGEKLLLAAILEIGYPGLWLHSFSGYGLMF